MPGKFLFAIKIENMPFLSLFLKILTVQSKHVAQIALEIFKNLFTIKDGREGGVVMKL